MTTARSLTAERTARRSFAGLPTSVKEARQWAETTLERWEVTVPDMLMVVVSELTSNALAHTRSGIPGGQFAVRFLLGSDRIRVEVRDAGPLDGRHLLCHRPTLLAEHGRGLLLVAASTYSWGSLETGQGVFAEMGR